MSTAATPAIGTISRRERKRPTSRPPEDPGEEPQHDGEDEDRDDPEDDHPRVVLDLPRLAGPQRETRSYRLEADAVHGAVDHPPVKNVGEGGDDDTPARDRVHDPVDNVSIEPVYGFREPGDGPRAERVVPIIDPVPVKEHGVEERPGGSPGEG